MHYKRAVQKQWDRGTQTLVIFIKNKNAKKVNKKSVRLCHFKRSPTLPRRDTKVLRRILKRKIIPWWTCMWLEQDG